MSDGQALAPETAAAVVPAAPARPAGVPDDAVWEDQIAEWVAGAVDADGRRQGPTRHWRADGTLAGTCVYRAGALDGPWQRFHPDGSLAREVAYVGGRPHGRLTAWGHDQRTTEPLQSCCVPMGAWQLQVDFRDGAGGTQRWYDRAGAHILPSGNPYPARPAAVPADADFEEEQDRWVQPGRIENGETEGVWQRWSKDGVLRERDEYHAGRAHGAWRRWDARGALVEECEWKDAARDGACRRVGVDPDFYADARVVEERGHFARDLAAGVWSTHDRDGELVRALDLGAALHEEALAAAPVLGPPRARAAWEAEAEALEAAGCLTEAVLAAARAAAAGGSADPLRLLLARRAPALTPRGALALATHVVSGADGKLAGIANALVRGADPAMLLRALATGVIGADRVALDLVDAALLMSPDRDECHVTRALVNVHLGRPDAARADAAALPPHAAEQRAFLERYTRIIFPEFGFWPAASDIQTLLPDAPVTPAQPLEAIRAHVQKYAARLHAIRGALRARADAGDSPAWLPPDLTALFAAGGAPSLEAWEFEEVVVDENDVPGPPALVKVDERPALDGLTVPLLMRLARREWNALCWLCWSAGLDRVALPDAVEPPGAFGAAVLVSVARTWRCRDQLSTSGLRAMTQGIPGFTWEGVDIDTMPGVLAEIAADEYVEMRALFYWLCDDGIQSPWQDNLRGTE